MKWFQILQKRVDGEDKYSFNFHNPLWALIGFVAGLCIGIGSTHAHYYVERILLK